VVSSALRELGALAEESAARGHDYLLGDELTALDIYAATALGVFAPLPEALCPGMHPAMRRAFETAAREGGTVVPAALLAHRDRMYTRHLGLPVDI
jgi:glutathione S-transferase